MALLTISEINVDSASVPAKRFIELFIHHDPDRVPTGSQRLLQGWRLLMIKGSTMDIVLSVDLSIHKPEPTESFVVIGDDSVPGVNINFTDERAAAAFTPLTFLDFDSSPYAVVLLGAMDLITSNALSLRRTGGSFQPLSILGDEFRKQIISELVWDVAVVGRRVRTNQCDFFSSLFPTRSYPNGLKYILRDWDSSY